MLIVCRPERFGTIARIPVFKLVVSENLGTPVMSKCSMTTMCCCPERTASCNCCGVVTDTAGRPLPVSLNGASAPTPPSNSAIHNGINFANLDSDGSPTL